MTIEKEAIGDIPFRDRHSLRPDHDQRADRGRDMRCRPRRHVMAGRGVGSLQRRFGDVRRRHRLSLDRHPFVRSRRGLDEYRRDIAKIDRFHIGIDRIIRGGLAMVNVTVSLFFAEISGSAVADVAAIGSVLIPAMKRKRYRAAFAAAVTSSSASLAIIIPPSIPMILYGALSDTSIVQLFVAGIVPGLLGGFAMLCLCWWFAVRFDLPREEAFSLPRLWRAFKSAGPALLLPLIILGGIFGGLVTATEGAGLAVVAALAISLFVYRELTLVDLYQALLEGITQTSVVMLLVASSAVLGLHLTEMEVPQNLARGITSITTDKYAVLMILNVLLLLMGMLLHGAAAIILVVPIVLPLVQMVGIDPVHFGIILTLNLAIGQQTPPVASVLVTSCSIARTDIWETTRVNLPFIALLIGLLLVVTYIPILPMALVEIFYR